MKLQISFKEIDQTLTDLMTSKGIDPILAEPLYLQGTTDHKLEIGYEADIDQVFKGKLAISFSNVKVSDNMVTLHYDALEGVNSIVAGLLTLLLSKNNAYAKTFRMLTIKQQDIIVDLRAIEALQPVLNILKIKAALNIEPDYIELEASVNLSL